MTNPGVSPWSAYCSVLTHKESAIYLRARPLSIILAPEVMMMDFEQVLRSCLSCPPSSQPSSTEATSTATYAPGGAEGPLQTSTIHSGDRHSVDRDGQDQKLLRILQQDLKQDFFSAVQLEQLSTERRSHPTARVDILPGRSLP